MTRGRARQETHALGARRERYNRPSLAERSLPAMAEEGGSGDAPEFNAKKHVWWFQRPTIRTLKAQIERDAAEFRLSGDRRENDETRLPLTESVNLGGFVLVEAFTPSTLSGLNRAVKNFLGNQESRDKLLAAIDNSRRGASGGLQNFHLFRRGVGIIHKDSYRDPELPAGVDAVWVQFNYSVPSLTMVIATFTLADEAGDLSTLMRQDYQSKALAPGVEVRGRAAWLRQRIPWARPRHYRQFHGISRAEDEKRHACIEAIRRHQEACVRWFYKRFAGRFAQAASSDQPIVRLLLTTEHVPFSEGAKWLRPVSLERSWDLWRATDADARGWFLSFDHWPYHDGRHTLTLAARRKDVGDDPTGGGRDTLTNWHVTQDVGMLQAPLAAGYAMVALLGIYGDALGRLRDNAGSNRLRGPMRQAEELDRHLIGDGLDAATVASDIRALTEDLARFRRYVPEYAEVVVNHPSNKKGKDRRKKPAPREFVALLRETLREQATRLAEDMAATTGNIRASAELRQAMANTRLQRIVLVLSVLAALVAIGSLVVAIASLVVAMK